MKYIKKNPEPSNFTEWKNKQKSSEVNLTYSSLQNPEKSDVKKSLLKEQGYICCYCCGRIELNNSHIEHFNPQSEKELTKEEAKKLVESYKKIDNDGHYQPFCVAIIYFLKQHFI